MWELATFSIGSYLLLLSPPNTSWRKNIVDTKGVHIRTDYYLLLNNRLTICWHLTWLSCCRNASCVHNYVSTFPFLSVGRYLCWKIISYQGHAHPSSQCFGTAMAYFSPSCDLHRLWLSCWIRLVFLLPKTFKLFGFPIFWLWAYLMKNPCLYTDS